GRPRPVPHTCQSSARSNAPQTVRLGIRPWAGFHMTLINTEDVNHRAKLIVHRFIARQVRKDPTVIDRARERLLVPDQGRPVRTWWVTEWRDILTRSPVAGAQFLTSRHEYAYQMRKCSPFFGQEITGLDFTDYQYRIRLWRKPKRALVLRQQRMENRNSWAYLQSSYRGQSPTCALPAFDGPWNSGVRLSTHDRSTSQGVSRHCG
uniref:hypothetical protein n=1 Tax=Microvirga roseola TaxID=2883126 RepID=UPI001E33361F